MANDKNADFDINELIQGAFDQYDITNDIIVEMTPTVGGSKPTDEPYDPFNDAADTFGENPDIVEDELAKLGAKERELIHENVQLVGGSESELFDYYENERNLFNVSETESVTGGRGIIIRNHLASVSGPEAPAQPTRTIVPTKVYPEEPEEDLDAGINPNDLIILIHSEIERKKIAGHHLDSMNSFNKIGIKQIVTKLFTADGRIKNLRDKTEEDREITDIAFSVEFTDINMSQPTTTKYKSGSQQMLTPNMARTKNLTYSAQLYINAKITASATKKNGTTVTRTAEIKDYRIASIPVMVGTEICNTFNQSKATLKNLEEDPLDSGGYFIVKGGEWCCDNLENITNNTFHVYKNMHMNEIVRGTFLSKPGDAFENSYQVILRYLNNGAITIEITTNKFDKFEIPYYLIFRALGMTRDREIVNHIVYGIDNEDPITKHMLQVLERAFEVEDPKFGLIRRSTEPTEIIMFIAQKITENASNINFKKDENAVKYLNGSILGIIDKYIFPHIGQLQEHRPKKLRFLGHLINKLLRVEMEVLDSTDRDSYKNKRIHAAGTSIAKTFKTDFNFTIVQPCKKHLIKDFKSIPFMQVNLVDSVKAAINSDDLERMLVQGITSGNRTITVKRNEVTNRISSQTLYHKNDLNVKSTLNTINTPNTSASKQNERADEMRRVHPTYLGYIDISQSADTGEKVGMTKQMACTASVCGASRSFLLKKILEEDSDIIPLDDVAPEQITAEKLAKVFVNGDWVGLCRAAHGIAFKYRTKRRYEDIHPFTTIVWEPLIREVHFWTDVGRLVRPLLIVYNNIKKYVTEIRKGNLNYKFRQWIKLRKSHLIGLQEKSITMDDLRKQRIIEYISPEEQENAYLAMNFEILKKHVNDVTHQFTHCDIDQAIFGVVALASPMANHSNATRITMYTNHRKQAAGWFALNWPFRIDKNTFFQYYCELPLVKCFSDSLTYPNGQNCTVALALYTGKGQEDSIIVNGSSVDCGMFTGSHFHYEKTELEKGEQFGNPDFARTMDIKKDAVYEYIENGFIKEGTIVYKGYVLIVKSAKIPKPVDNYLYVDRSIIYKFDEPAIVEKVVTPRNDEDVLIAKVKLRSYRPLAVGDKLSSRTGNKGIVACKYDRTDMPYTEDGLVPDLIVNAHSIPTRMAVNQLIECTMAQVAVEEGCHIDATSFKKNDVEGMVKKLESFGIKYGGYRRMFNGMTGDWIDTLIFIGPTSYQRLQKFVVDESYATRAGPTSALTRQPLDGKNNDGGLRIGEMEKDVFCAHGTMRALFEKFYNDSDGIELPICRICGNRAVVNEKVGIYKCKYCGDDADIANVPSSWVASLFMQESSAMNVRLNFTLAPYEYTRMEE
jgi:DNA-directed RNA polymerase beta subunit